MRNCILLFLLFATFVFGQKADLLVLKIHDNLALMKSDMSGGFKELLYLEKIANKENNLKAKLEVLNNKAFYYFTKAEYHHAYRIAKELEEKAIKAQDKRLQALAMNRVGITLNFLEIYNESEKKLLEAKSFIEANNFENKNLIKASNYQFLSDLYSHLNHYDKAIYFIKKTIPEYKKIKNPIEQKSQIARGYSNIGLQYLYIDEDSAAYYFEKSLSLQDKIEIKNYNVSNYLGLGDVYNKKGDYKKSIEFLKKAEEINNHVQDGYYMISIYELMQDSYKKLGDDKQRNKYRLLYLESLQHENEEKLHGVNIFVNEAKQESENIIKESKKMAYLNVSFAIFSLFSLIILMYFLKKHKKRKIEKEEIHSKLLLKQKQLENLEGKTTELLNEVVSLAKENNEKFYPRFLDLYPDFEHKILQINPKLTNSELEFCALLKLNFSSKEIANYTFISIRTVQNKKYRIRNKLNIPNETDTYVFFNKI